MTISWKHRFTRLGAWFLAGGAAVALGLGFSTLARGQDVPQTDPPAVLEPQAEPPGDTPGQAEPADGLVEAEAPAEEISTYDPQGRRDPFLSLLARGADDGASSSRPAGLSGLSINEVSLRGIVRSQGSVLAIVQSPDNKTYLMRGGDQLLDGVVKAVSTDAVVFLQEVKDPLSLVKEREVRKPLRTPAEDR